MYDETLPSDSDSSKSFCMCLSEKLLEKCIGSSWEHLSFSDDGLWLVGINPETVKLPEMSQDVIYVEDCFVDTTKLISKDELMKYLEETDGMGSDLDEFLELCRKIEFGEIKYLMKQRRDAKDNSPIYETMGGTSAETLAKRGKSRPDGKSISRIAKLSVAAKGLFFTADSGVGETGPTGLIVPKFGNNPENHVSILLTFESFSELMLLTKVHYQAWLAAQYIHFENFEGALR